MKVDLLDLTRQYQKIKHEVDPVVDFIITSQRFINGPVVQVFQENFAKYCDTKYAVGCSSGTDALLMSLTALDIGRGDEVITTPFTFFSTVEVIIRRGAKPVFVDIQEDTFNIDVDQLEKAITKKTKAIIPVHIFGQCADMDRIMSIAEKHNLHVIEDAAQAISALWQGKKAGSIGTTGCFSFFPSKNLGGFGDGGMVTTNDETLYNKMLQIRQHGISLTERYKYDYLGGNFRLDALQAGVLDVKLRHIDEWSNARRQNAKYYYDHLKSYDLPFVDDRGHHIYNQFVIKTDNRDDVIEKLKEAQIGYGIYYPNAIHLQKPMKYLKYKKGSLPVCEKVCEQVLALPIYPDLLQEELEYVAYVMEK